MRGDQGADPAGRGHHPLLQQPEVQPRAVPDDDLAVEDRAGRHLGERGGGDVGEPVGEVAALLGPHPGRAAAADDDQPVAVPLGLVQAAAGQRVRRAGSSRTGLASCTATGPASSGGRPGQAGDGQRAPGQPAGSRGPVQHRASRRHSIETVLAATRAVSPVTVGRSRSSRLKAASDGPSVNRPSRDHRPQLRLPGRTPNACRPRSPRGRSARRSAGGQPDVELLRHQPGREVEVAEAGAAGGPDAGLLGELGAGQLLRPTRPGRAPRCPAGTPRTGGRAGSGTARPARSRPSPAGITSAKSGRSTTPYRPVGAVVALDHVLAHPDPGVLGRPPAARRPHRPSLADRCHHGRR